MSEDQSVTEKKKNKHKVMGNIFVGICNTDEPEKVGRFSKKKVCFLVKQNNSLVENFLTLNNNLFTNYLFKGFSYEDISDLEKYSDSL